MTERFEVKAGRNPIYALSNALFNLEDCRPNKSLIIGLKVNQKITKYLEVSREAKAQVELQVDGYIFQHLTNFSYL